MAEVLLKLYPGMLFEAVAVCVAAGLIVIFSNVARKNYAENDSFIKITAWILIAGIALRMIFSSQMQSSRYCAGLFVPSLFLAGYGCFYFSALLKKNILKAEKWHKISAVLLSVTLVLLCLGRVFYMSKGSDDNILKAAEFIQRDAKNYYAPFIAADRNEKFRFAYYLNMATMGIDANENPDGSLILRLEDFLREMEFKYDAVYFITYDELEGEELARAYRVKSMEQVASFEPSGRHKNTLKIFRYTPVSVQVERFEQYEPGGNPQYSLIKNGDFERIISTETSFYDSVKEFYAKSGNSIDPGSAFPREWDVRYAHFDPETKCLISTDSRAPISGGRSLRVETNNIAEIYNTQQLKAQSATLSFWVQCVDASAMSVKIRLHKPFNPDNKRTNYVLPEIVFPEFGLYRVTVSIPEEMLCRHETFSVALRFYSGYFLLDDVMVELKNPPQAEPLIEKEVSPAK